MDPTGEIAVEKSGRKSCCTSQKAAAKSEHAARRSKATASTAIATGNLRQGRLMADHGGLYSTTKLWQIGAKDGQGGMRARFFSHCEEGKRRGTAAGRHAR
jgi:hypothetical protein